MPNHCHHVATYLRSVSRGLQHRMLALPNGRPLWELTGLKVATDLAEARYLRAARPINPQPL